MRIQWTQTEQEKIFNWIEETYYANRSFGSVPKADIDLFFFSCLLDHLKAQNEPVDDFTIGKKLGITNSRVRSLKERKELRYSSENEIVWKEEFVSLIPYAKYDDVSHMVKMNISDVNLLKNVRHFMETNNWFDEYQLNPRLFQCRADFFLEMVEALSDQDKDEHLLIDTATQKRLKEINKKASQDEQNYIEKILSGSIEEGLKGIAIEGSKQILAGVLQCIPFGGIAKMAVDAFIKVIQK